MFRYALGVALCCVLLGTAASATTVTVSVTALGSDRFRSDYSVSNDTLGAAIEEFTIFFEQGLYQDLVGSVPADWDGVVVEPEIVLGIPEDGFFDALALSGGIGSGETLDGFSVEFDFLGGALPGPQPFEVIDPTSFSTLDSGVTTVVPLPGAFVLLLSGLVGLRLFGAKRPSPGRNS